MTEEPVQTTDDDHVEDDTPNEKPADESTTGEQPTDEDILSAEETDLVAEIASHDESLAEAVEERFVAIESERQEQETEIDDLRTRLKRKQADFQNYKKRAKKRQEQLEKRATEDVVNRLIDVRDNLKRAVEEEHEDVESLRSGVELTLKELDRVFEDENVAEIDPEPGAEVDPQRHEVMLRVESDHPEDTIADVYQPGYEMADKVLQAAQVTVSDGSGDGSGE
ncbi:molecular chaperone GrpE [Haladaptatus litoreus]|uniref:Protein GrpE n=1 Tax=Haladaptatus litoreus TaxID=553468 RepID=A0A1N6WUW8_9EURY|nr:nucleotide exchange factor GrpE [Haladaptatus litoreus]SIQ93862.1 molecular chaperone GrpE [Haladaptatus litoreus]